MRRLSGNEWDLRIDGTPVVLGSVEDNRGAPDAPRTRATVVIGAKAVFGSVQISD